MVCLHQDINCWSVSRVQIQAGGLTFNFHRPTYCTPSLRITRECLVVSLIISVFLSNWSGEKARVQCMRRSSILVMLDYSSFNVKAVATVLASCCCDYLFSHRIRHPLSFHGLAAPLGMVHSRYMGQLRHAHKKEHCDGISTHAHLLTMAVLTWRLHILTWRLHILTLSPTLVGLWWPLYFQTGS